jgi:hypothetical protein
MMRSRLPFANRGRKRSRDEEQGEPTNEELIEYREKYAIVQELVKFGCVDWPDTFELAIELKRAPQRSRFDDTNSHWWALRPIERVPEYAPVVVTWGWISHSPFVFKVFSLVDHTGSTYKGGECRFEGWHYPEHRNAIPVPHYVLQWENPQTVTDFHTCLQWIIAYHTALHDTQVDVDAVTAVVPSLSRKVQDIWDTMFMEIYGKLKVLTAMDQFGL